MPVSIKSVSAWLIVISAAIMMAIVHPSLLSYLMIGLNVGLMIITREVAALEHRRICIPCAAIGGAMAIAVVVFMLRINWIAI